MKRIEELDARSLRLRELVAAARAMIADDGDLESGVRRILKIAFSLNIQEDAHFLSLRGYEAQASDRIRGEHRNLWSLEFLAENDKIFGGLDEEDRPEILADCRSIVAAFDGYERAVQTERESVRREAKERGWEL